MSYVDDSDDQLIRFSPCQRRSCVAVSIEDDDVVERTERVVIRLERTDDLNNRIRFGVSSGVIEVEDDNDGMCYNMYRFIMYAYQCDFINTLIWSLSAVAMVGLEKTFYPFSEDSTETTVCIEVFGSNSDCPVDFAITVNLTTSDGNAGELL